MKAPGFPLAPASRAAGAVVCIAAFTAAAISSEALAAPEVIAAGDVSADQAAVTGSQGGSLQAGSLRIGTEQPGQLRALDGGIVDISGQTSIGTATAASGLFEIDGFGSTAYLGGGVAVGVHGSGMLQITNGGSVMSFGDVAAGDEAGASGIVRVDGFGSTLSAWNGWFGEWHGTVGRLDVLNGGRVNFASTLVLSPLYSGGGTATASVRGFGSSLIADAIEIGSTGRLDVADGATVQATDAFTLGGGTLALASGTISLPGRLNASAGSTIEGSGAILGQLHLDETALLSVGTAETLEFGAGGVTHEIHGSALVDGGTLHFGEASAAIGQYGQLIGRDATLRSQHWANGGSFSLLSGSNDVIGLFENHATVAVANEAEATFFSPVINQGRFDVRPGSSAVFLGDVSGAGSYDGGGNFTFLGSFQPGNSPAVVSFDGDLILGQDSVLEIEIYGTNLGAYDRLEVEGLATAGGTLEVVFGDGFMPTPGDRFDFLVADEIAGSFDYQSIMTNGVQLDLVQSAGTFSLVAVPEPAMAMTLTGATLLLLRRRRMI